MKGIDQKVGREKKCALIQIKDHNKIIHKIKTEKKKTITRWQTPICVG